MLKARLRELRVATETRIAQSAELMAQSAHSLARSTEQIAKSSSAVYQSRDLIERLHKERKVYDGHHSPAPDPIAPRANERADEQVDVKAI